jgi:hypothetical protein
VTEENAACFIVVKCKDGKSLAYVSLRGRTGPASGDETDEVAKYAGGPRSEQQKAPLARGFLRDVPHGCGGVRYPVRCHQLGKQSVPDFGSLSITMLSTFHRPSTRDPYAHGRSRSAPASKCPREWSPWRLAGSRIFRWRASKCSRCTRPRKPGRASGAAWCSGGLDPSTECVGVVLSNARAKTQARLMRKARVRADSTRVRSTNETSLCIPIKKEKPLPCSGSQSPIA